MLAASSGYSCPVRLIPVGAMGVVDIGVDVFSSKVLAKMSGWLHLSLSYRCAGRSLSSLCIDKLRPSSCSFLRKSDKQQTSDGCLYQCIFSVAGTERVTLNGAVAVALPLWAASHGNVVTSTENAPSSAADDRALPVLTPALDNPAHRWHRRTATSR